MMGVSSGSAGRKKRNMNESAPQASQEAHGMKKGKTAETVVSTLVAHDGVGKATANEGVKVKDLRSGGVEERRSEGVCEGVKECRGKE